MPPRTDVEDQARPRTPLSRDRVLHAAVDLADREGLDALTMRRLAQALDVEAMSLYHHVANKEAVLDGIVETVITEILAEVAELDGPDPADDWRGALRARILTARSVMLRHRWAPRVLETRSHMNPTIIAWFDGVLGILRAGGFSWDLAHHAMHALGSQALGFQQELFAPDVEDEDEDDAMAMLEAMGEHFPHLVGMLTSISHTDGPEQTLGWCDDQTEFEFGIDVLLDGLDRRLAAERQG